MRTAVLKGALLIFLLCTSLVTEKAVAQKDLYSGKQLTMIIPAGPGGGYALYAQIVARYLGKHIPGEPSIITQHMPGAGGNVAANYLFNVAPKDGTVIGALFSTITVTQVLEPTGARFDVQKFSWLGSVAPMINTVGVWYKAPATTITAAKEQQDVIAATGKSSELYIYPKIMNELLGTKFKIVLGYDGSGAILLAMQRGEVDGMAMALDAWSATRPEWVKDKKLVHLAQTGFQRDPSMPDVPTLVELAKSPTDKEIMSFLSGPAELGRVFAAPPGIPNERLQVLRKAFNDTVHDEEFKKDLAARSLPLSPRSGEQVETYVRKLTATSEQSVQQAKKLLGF